MTRPLVITMGDPAGIGPEILLQAAAAGELPVQWEVIGSRDYLLRTAVSLGMPPSLVSSLNLIDVPAWGEITPGQPDQTSGIAALSYIDMAIDRIQRGGAAGVVTLPVNKKAIARKQAGFIGHTEYLAQAFRVDEVTMCLVGHKVRVGLMTTHIPLKDVASRIDIGGIIRTARRFYPALRLWTGKTRPRLAVCGLDPHAGEEGHIGTFDQKVVLPAVQTLSAEMNIQGPLPACSLFARVLRDEFDGVIAMYHDQGLIPVKMDAFGHGVNVTLGLPCIRTSVDHGTACSLVGTGTASRGSFLEAVRLAARLNTRT